MKKSTIFLLILLTSSLFLFSQDRTDSLEVFKVYPPTFYDGFTPEESWEIHKAAYIKQLKSKGLSDDEIKRSMVTYEKDKNEFFARVKEQHRLAEIQRNNAGEQRNLAYIQRKKADELRKKADSIRVKADELRKQADIERAKVSEQRAINTAQREKADELRKQADSIRAKANELRKQAALQRAKPQNQIKKENGARNNFKTILLKNSTLSKKSDAIKQIPFKVASSTTLLISIKAEISFGTVLIEIYNPKGTKEGELSLGQNSNSSSSVVNEGIKKASGAVDKTISNAEIGDWQIKITPKKSQGNVDILVAKYIKPTMDE